MSSTSQSTPLPAGKPTHAIAGALKLIAADIERQGHYQAKDGQRMFNSTDNPAGLCCLYANPTMREINRNHGMSRLGDAVTTEMARRVRDRTGMTSLAHYSNITPTAEVLELLRADV